MTDSTLSSRNDTAVPHRARFALDLILRMTDGRPGTLAGSVARRYFDKHPRTEAETRAWEDFRLAHLAPGFDELDREFTRRAELPAPYDYHCQSCGAHWIVRPMQPDELVF